MGSSISFTGLTGFDTQAIVEALMEAERRPLTIIEEEQALLQQKRSFFSDMSGKLSSLDSAISKLSTTSGVNAKTITTSDSDIATASATAFATLGAFQLDSISQLATKHSESFVGVSDAGAAFASGSSFAFSVGGNDYTIDLSDLDASDRTLEALRNRINNQAGDDVNAIIINTGDDADAQKLILRSIETGEDNRITGISTDIQVTTSGGDVALSTVGGEQVLGQDAQFKFNGVTINRGSNTVDDLLEGVTINLKQESNSAVDFNVATDTTAIETNINAFISAYNEVNTVIQQQFSLNPETGQAGPLSGDATLRQIQSTLQSLVVGGVTDADGNRYSLGSIGVDIDRESGDLSLDSSRLRDALENSDSELLLDLFVPRGTPTSSRILFSGSNDNTQAGTYDINVTSNDGNGNISAILTVNGTDHSISTSNGLLTGPKGTAAEGLRFRVDGNATGDLGSIYFSVGVAEQFERQLDNYITPISGLLPRLDNSFEKQVADLNDQIAIFEERLAERERVLLQEFLAAEQAISSLQSQQSALNGQAATLFSGRNNS